MVPRLRRRPITRLSLLFNWQQEKIHYPEELYANVTLNCGSQRFKELKKNNGNGERRRHRGWCYNSAPYVFISFITTVEDQLNRIEVMLMFKGHWHNRSTQCRQMGKPQACTTHKHGLWGDSEVYCAEHGEKRQKKKPKPQLTWKLRLDHTHCHLQRMLTYISYGAARQLTILWVWNSVARVQDSGLDWERKKFFSG